MILDYIAHQEGTKRPWRWIVAAVALLVLVALGVARCQPPAPTVPGAALPVASPTPAAQAIASSSTAAAATGTAKVTIRRPVAGPHEPQIRAENLHNGAESQSGSSGPHAQDYEEIVIEVTQAATAAATSEASAHHLGGVTQMVPEHARLGAFVGTIPGAIAITYQVAAVDIPPWVLGTPLELGLEVEGNAQQLGAGISVGRKAFATGGGYVGWSGPGWFLGLGMRF